MAEFLTEKEASQELAELHSLLGFLRYNGVHTTLTPSYLNHETGVTACYRVAIRGRVVVDDAGAAEARAVLADLRLALARRIVERAMADQG